MHLNGTNITRRAILAATTALLFASAPAMAHGGMEHVMGVVEAVTDTSLTVKTTAGKSVEVALDGKTTFTRKSQAIQKTEIKVGDRVVVHAEKSGNKLVAHTVQLGTKP